MAAPENSPLLVMRARGEDVHRSVDVRPAGRIVVTGGVVARGRVITGVGRAVSPVDGDEVTVQLGLRSGAVAYAGAKDIMAGRLTYVGGVAHLVWSISGAQAKAHGEQFVGCEFARRAALQIYKVFGGRSAGEALALGTDALLAAMGGAPPRNVQCVAAVADAVRRALIDARARALAEEIVELRHASVRR
jgi:hypothetical protein